MTGLDGLRAQLENAGFRFGKDALRSEYNACDWYAYRRSNIAARRCECNDNKEGVQLVIRPHEVTGFPVKPRASVEFDVSGEFRGMWWRFRATCNADEAMERLETVEAALVAAWNGLEK